MIRGKISIDEKVYVYSFDNYELIIDDYPFVIINDELMSKFSYMTELKASAFSHKYSYVTFFVNSVVSAGTSGLKLNIVGYIESYKYDISYDRLTYESKELNYFYNVSNSYQFIHNNKTMESVLKVKSFDEIDKEFNFKYQEMDVILNLNIRRSFRDEDIVPIKFVTQLSYIVENTDDYKNLFNLYSFTKKFLWFYTYRKNIKFDSVLIKEKEENGKYYTLGEFHANYLDKSDYVEHEDYVRQRIIKFESVESCFDKFLSYISSKDVYTSHIPYNSRDMQVITPARFILLMAAFEWEFKVFYGDVKYESNEKYRKAKDNIIAAIECIRNESCGKQKKYVKSFLKTIQNSGVSLSEKLTYAYKENEEILKPFLTILYKDNGIKEYKITDIATRLQSQRNNYAHGNIDKEVDSDVIIDLLTVEWLLYSIKLSSFGMEKKEVQRIINQLFSRNMYIK